MNNKRIWAYVNESNQFVWTTGGQNGKNQAVFTTRSAARAARAFVPSDSRLVKFVPSA